MSDEEIEKGDTGEDVSGPAKTTDQEKLSADASFRDADRQLNEVYNALRARLSPSKSDRLKKEQLAWMMGGCGGSSRQGKCRGKTTHAGDGDVTKMTLARPAELETRPQERK